MTPDSPTFDGYEPTTERSEKLTFGSIRLGAGAHTVRFETTGKNAAASGYAIGIDQIAIQPSGALLEAEALPVNSSSGDAQTKEDMSALGVNLWGGNHHKKYAAGAIADYITFDVNYDQWMESNFENMTFQNAEVINTDPAIAVSSRETQAQSPAWLGQAQAQSPPQADYNGFSNRTVRTVISGGSFTKSAVMMRVKFTASSLQQLQINSAYFGVRQGNTPNFAAVPIQLYFDNPTVKEGDPDGVGAVGNGAQVAATIQPDHHIWSNWFTYIIDATNPVPDHLVSFYVPAGGSGMVGWQDTPTVHSYEVMGDFAANAGDLTNPIVNPNGVQTNDVVLGASECSAWTNVGVATSQVYDTLLAAPSFDRVTWDSTKPNGSTVLVRVRTAGSADMAGASAWNVASGGTASPVDLGGMSSGRYVQFQATLTAGNPYTAYPTLDNVDIHWDGQTALAEITGTITRGPGYGQFKVLVDGQNPVNALQVKIDLSETLRGKTYEHSLKTQVKARNSGK